MNTTAWRILDPKSERPLQEHQLNINRRHFFGKSASGIGLAALANLLHGDAAGAPPIRPFMRSAPKARNIIYLFQNGAPSHVDLFDYKPELDKRHGSPIPDEAIGTRRFSTMTGKANGKLILHPIEPFSQHGDSGAWVSRFMPYTAQIADELCFIKSLHTEQVNHAPAISFLLSGSELPGRPTLGAWLNYGIGSPCDDLPGFVVMTSVSKGTTCGQIFYDFYWGSGFLPSRFQGVKLRGSVDPVLYLNNPDGMPRTLRRALLDDLAVLNTQHFQDVGDPEIQTRIAQYEMAYRMQTSVPDLTDLSREPKHILDLYGKDVTEPGTFAWNCLMTRRLVERGVRYVQCMHAGWDQHNSITTELYKQCEDTDRASAALVIDLKQRGLLDDTLVIWGGEFGRTPFLQGDISNRVRWGRDHYPYVFTVWMAGGGVKPGMTYGASDELAMSPVENPVHVHDLQATILHLAGIDHERLTYRFRGRDFRLTDVHGQVVHDIMA